MNREFLKNLGLEDDVVDKVMAEYGKSVQSYKDKLTEADSLKQEKESLETQLNDLQQTLQTKETELSGVDEIKNELEKYKLKDLKTSVAIKAGIPLELAGRLSGETEEELKADAETLAGFVNKKPTLPLKPNEPDVNKENQEMEQMLDSLLGEK